MPRVLNNTRSEIHAIIFELYIKYVPVTSYLCRLLTCLTISNCLNCIKVFCCTSVINDTCMYTCRFVSNILNALVQMHTQMLMYTQPHTHSTMCKQDGHCLLHIASLKGHDRIVKILLQAGATVDLQNKVEKCY